VLTADHKLPTAAPQDIAAVAVDLLLDDSWTGQDDVSEMPPVRLHDLRHGAACLALTAGGDMKTLQHQLGHASIAVTADISKPSGIASDRVILRLAC
jgi:integrase